MARCQNGAVIPHVPLFWRDVANAAVTVIEVVAVHETGGPDSRRIEVGEALARERWVVLGGALISLRRFLSLKHWACFGRNPKKTTVRL